MRLGRRFDSSGPQLLAQLSHLCHCLSCCSLSFGSGGLSFGRDALSLGSAGTAENGDEVRRELFAVNEKRHDGTVRGDVKVHAVVCRPGHCVVLLFRLGDESHLVCHVRVHIC